MSIINKLIWRITSKRNENAKKIQDSYIRSVPNAALPKLEFHIEDSCNLNCIGCNHFSPVACKNPADYEELKKDLERVAVLFGNKIGVISILGGEPLLNPEIERFLSICRELFPSNYIRVFTNGTLIKKMPESFWECCKQNNIAIACTRYPIKLDYYNIKKMVEGYGITFEPMNRRSKKMTLYLLDAYGRQDAKDNYYRLCTSNKCTFLKHGKLYPCAYAPNIEHFNKYFKKNIPLDEDDGIDIYKVNDYKEIMEFLSRPIPFCRFCIREKNKTVKWRVSEKSLDEWYYDGNWR